MAFSEIELHKIKKTVGDLCQEKSPEHIRDELRFEYRIQGHDVVLFEIRPHWQDPTHIIEAPFAKLKWVRSKAVWKLYWQRADMKWHKYPPLEESGDISELVAEIRRDPNGCFFG